MPSRLERARRDPHSMKAKILDSARKIFGKYGYNDTTTRMIAKDVGIDISTLYYHWGEKQDLYEAVLADVGDEIQEKLNEIERNVSGQSLTRRLETALDMMCDYLFSHSEVPNLILFGYFNTVGKQIFYGSQVLFRLRIDSQDLFWGDKFLFLRWPSGTRF